MTDNTNNKIELQININDLAHAVENVLKMSPNALFRNPLPNIIAECVTNAGDMIRSTVDKLTKEYIESDEFAQRIKQVYREALMNEAARLGRNAARAAVNAKDKTNE